MIAPFCQKLWVCNMIVATRAGNGMDITHCVTIYACAEKHMVLAYMHISNTSGWSM